MARFLSQNSLVFKPLGLDAINILSFNDEVFSISPDSVSSGISLENIVNSKTSYLKDNGNASFVFSVAILYKFKSLFEADTRCNLLRNIALSNSLGVLIKKSAYEDGISPKITESFNAGISSLNISAFSPDDSSKGICRRIDITFSCTSSADSGGGTDYYVLKSELPELIQKYLDENGYVKGEHLDITSYRGDIHLMDNNGNTVLKSSVTPSGNITLGNNKNGLDLSGSALFIHQPIQPDGFLKISGADGVISFEKTTVDTTNLLEHYEGQIRLRDESGKQVLYASNGVIYIGGDEQGIKLDTNGKSVSIYSQANSITLTDSIIEITAAEPNSVVRVTGAALIEDFYGNNILEVEADSGNITIGHFGPGYSGTRGDIYINNFARATTPNTMRTFLSCSDTSITLGNSNNFSVTIIGSVSMENVLGGMYFHNDSTRKTLTIGNKSIKELNLGATAINIGALETSAISIGSVKPQPSTYPYAAIKLIYDGTTKTLSNSGSITIKAT